MAARQVSVDRFKGPTFSVVNPVTATVATSATRVFRNNPERVLALMVNQGNVDGYVGFDTEVSATKGILISANGGYLILSADEDGELVAQEIYAISPGGAATWYFVEVRRK